MAVGTASQQAVISRFTTMCQADGRVVAAFLGGSHAAGTADEHSDLDLYLILADAAYAGFFAARRAWMHRLGDPVFLEDFDGFGFAMVVFIFADGVAGELALARESRFEHLHAGPFHVLTDKKGILAQKLFPVRKPTEAEQHETLHRLVYWFWHDLAMFSVAMARGRLWTAYGILGDLRLKCVNLARLRHDFTAWADGYGKVEQAVGAQDLAALQATFCPVERSAMLEAAGAVVRYYVRIAPPLARRHGVPYPTDLERVMSGQLAALCG